jgi:HPr serine kinase-like protein
MPWGQLPMGIAVETGVAEVAIPSPLLDRPVGDRGGRIVADRSRALVHIPEVATFAVLGGTRVVVEAARDADPTTVRGWLQSTIQAFALAQRGLFALHANAVDIAGRRVAICGASGAGKSTVVLRLGQRGHAMVADDICPLDPGDGGRVMHQPARRAARVSPETAAALGFDVSGAVASAVDGKLILPAPVAEPGPVDLIVGLVVAQDGGVTRRRLRATHAVAMLQSNAYRVGILQPVWPDEVFDWAAQVASRLPVTVLVRPSGLWTVDEVATAIEEAAVSPG